MLFTSIGKKVKLFVRTRPFSSRRTGITLRHLPVVALTILCLTLGDVRTAYAKAIAISNGFYDFAFVKDARFQYSLISEIDSPPPITAKVGSGTADATAERQPDFTDPAAPHVTFIFSTSATAECPPSPSTGFASAALNSVMIRVTNTSNETIPLFIAEFVKYDLIAITTMPGDRAFATIAFTWSSVPTEENGSIFLYSGGIVTNSVSATNGGSEFAIQPGISFLSGLIFEPGVSADVSIGFALSQASASALCPEPGPIAFGLLSAGSVLGLIARKRSS